MWRVRDGGRGVEGAERCEGKDVEGRYGGGKVWRRAVMEEGRYGGVEGETEGCGGRV